MFFPAATIVFERGNRRFGQFGLARRGVTILCQRCDFLAAFARRLAISELLGDDGEPESVFTGTAAFDGA